MYSTEKEWYECDPSTLESDKAGVVAAYWMGRSHYAQQALEEAQRTINDLEFRLMELRSKNDLPR